MKRHRQVVGSECRCFIAKLLRTREEKRTGKLTHFACMHTEREKP